MRIAVGLKCNEIVRILFHQRQPVNDKLICFLPGKSQLVQGVLQKSGGVASGYAEALGKIINNAVYALPIKVVVRFYSAVAVKAGRVITTGMEQDFFTSADIGAFWGSYDYEVITASEDELPALYE